MGVSERQLVDIFFSTQKIRVKMNFEWNLALLYCSPYSSVILFTTKLPIGIKVRMRIIPLKTKLPLALILSPK